MGVGVPGLGEGDPGVGLDLEFWKRTRGKAGRTPQHPTRVSDSETFRLYLLASHPLKLSPPLFWAEFRSSFRAMGHGRQSEERAVEVVGYRLQNLGFKGEV